MLTALGDAMSEPTSRRDFLAVSAGVAALGATGCGGAEPSAVDADPAGDPANSRPTTPPESGGDALASGGPTTGFIVGPAAMGLGLNQAQQVVIPIGQPHLHASADVPVTAGVAVQLLAGDRVHVARVVATAVEHRVVAALVLSVHRTAPARIELLEVFAISAYEVA